MRSTPAASEAQAETGALSGPAVYFDGRTSARRAVSIEVSPAALSVYAAGGGLLARWLYSELEQIPSPAGVLRLGRTGVRSLERIEVRDPHLAARIDALSVPVDRTGAAGRRVRRKAVVWSIVAVVSLLFVAVYGVPELASQIAPYVPYGVERKLGEAVEPQLRAMLDPGQQGRNFECGWTDAEKPGQAALNTLVTRLESAAALPLPLQVVVLRSIESNALALPGGHIYVFKGLIAQSENPDELAGVIAHEIGHVAHRDGVRSLLQTAGLSFLFGLVLGDFVGGGAVVIGARTLLQLAYSREVETAADLYAVELMQRVGGDGAALASILERIAGGIEPGSKLLRNHPETRERIAAIHAAATAKTATPILEPADWTALRRICAER